MKYWKYSLYISLFSFVTLLLVFLLPDHYSIFIRNKNGVDAGLLFPVMWFIWLIALAAFALNNIFADKWYITQNLQMSQLKKYLPSLLGLPALFSFIWFIYSWLMHRRWF